jgi:hypothetical protein
MFFHRNQRIRTEPRIPGESEEEPRDNKRRIKIKNIRFSIDHEGLQAAKLRAPLPEEPQSDLTASNPPPKRIGVGERLPEIVVEREEGDAGRELRQVSVQHRKKDVLLNSIVCLLLCSWKS